MLQSNHPIVIDLPHEVPSATIYYSADLHVGNAAFDEKAWKRFEALLKPDDAYVVFCGDMMEYATKTSKSDLYTAWRPHVQREWWIEHLKPIKNKVLCLIDGNHEYRASRDVDCFPLLEIAAVVGIMDRYRSEAAFVDVGVGRYEGYSRAAKDRQMRYVIRAQHRAQNQVNFATADAFDGIDIFVSGHTHRAKSQPLSKLVYDAKNKTVSQKDVVNVVPGSLMGYAGSYGERSGYRPTSMRQYKTILQDKRKQVDLVEFSL